MNARHAHDLIRVKFPVFVATEHEWQILLLGDSEDTTRIEAFLRTNFGQDELVVRVTRKVGGLVPVSEAVALVASSLGQAEIRIANRQFTKFAVIGLPGVATAWKQASLEAGLRAVPQAEESQGAA